MQRLNFYFADTQISFLRVQAERTGFSVSELLRKMVDHCSQPFILNQLIPHCSGQMTMGVLR